jgi:RNA polymerase primary sigma factor
MDQDQQSRLKELIAKGKEQGFLTYTEVNDHLPEGIRACRSDRYS